MSAKEPKRADPAYYLTLFKIEGHKTYRAHIAGDLTSLQYNMGENAPTITEKKVYRVDRVTGEITLYII